MNGGRWTEGGGRGRRTGTGHGGDTLGRWSRRAADGRHGTDWTARRAVVATVVVEWYRTLDLAVLERFWALN